LPVGDTGARDLAVVEDFYARRERRALVQISPAEQHAGLDAELARRGWSTQGDTDVLVAAADTVLARTRPGDVAIAARPDARWVATWAACEGRHDAAEHAHHVLARIEPAAAYALAGAGAGVGLAVCVAQAVVHALARRAAHGGAQRIYLQVEAGNEPAHALYARAGFTRSHSYHYRLAPGR
jgi:N-acetylglutamate synthase